MKNLSKITLVLTVIGAIFYLILSMANVDVIANLTGGSRTIGGDFIRILIGLSALYTLIYSFSKRK
jgi:uncharacterized membrane protein YuzA (DUF378 family)